jgi:hypothetical protein
MGSSMFLVKRNKAPESLPKAFCRPRTPNHIYLIYLTALSSCKFSLLTMTGESRLNSQPEIRKLAKYKSLEL